MPASFSARRKPCSLCRALAKCAGLQSRNAPVPVIDEVECGVVGSAFVVSVDRVAFPSVRLSVDAYSGSGPAIPHGCSRTSLSTAGIRSKPAGRYDCNSVRLRGFLLWIVVTVTKNQTVAMRVGYIFAARTMGERRDCNVRNDHPIMLV